MSTPLQRRIPRRTRRPSGSAGERTLTAVPSPDAGRVPITRLALYSATSAVERRLIERWARREGAGLELVALDSDDLASRLTDPAVSVVPVRITWVPSERVGERATALRDLLLRGHPLRPWPIVQEMIVRRTPERALIVLGAPATVGELRASFAAQAGDHAAAGDFAGFVRRQALVAADRAERTVIGDRYKVPRLLAEQITASAHFREEVAKLAEREGRPFDAVLADAEACVKELAAVQSPVWSEVFRFVLRPMHARAWTVKTDGAPLERLRELNRTSALVFLPAHRSYVDPLVLDKVLDERGFPRNHLLGGDNMSFFPVGPLGRRAGVIFIRRNFGEDRAYKLAMREFLGHLVAKRFNLEWYIEGGRSRTGKLRPPRYGLLSYLARAVEGGRAPDVQLVPVSIAYEHMQEASAIADEQGGWEKPREDFLWFARYIRAQSRNVGTALVTFGEPISLRGALADAGAGPAQLEKVAFRIADGINRVTPLTGSALVTYALLGAGGRALTEQEVTTVTEPLLDYTERRGIHGPVEELRDPRRVRAALDALVAQGVAERYSGGVESVWRVAPDGHRVAAISRNTAIHWFVTRAIGELVLLELEHTPLDDAGLARGLEVAFELRDLLKFEFFFASKAQFVAELQAELDLLAPGGWAGRAASDILAEAPTLLADRVLRSFLEAQLVVARLLADREPGEVWEEGPFITRALGVGRQLNLQGRIDNADSVSKDLYAGAIRLAGNRGLLEAAGQDGEALALRRAAFLADVERVRRGLSVIAELDRAKLAGVLA